MIVADHVVRDTIKRIVSRKKGRINCSDVEQNVRDIYNGPLVKTTS